MNYYLVLSLAVIPFATWRVANMLADHTQHGPSDILSLIRSMVGVRYDANSNPIAEPGSLAEGIMCVYCNSIWVGLMFTVLLIISPMVAFYIGLPFALSAVAILLEGATEK